MDDAPIEFALIMLRHAKARSTFLTKRTKLYLTRGAQQENQINFAERHCNLVLARGLR
jgi:hypothetical protein